MPSLKLKSVKPKASLKKPRKIVRGTINSSNIVTKAPTGLKESTLVKVFEVPLEMLVEHSENPNEQTERTFDEMVSKVKRDGFDEPLIVVPEMKTGRPTGKYMIISGHHRKKVAVTLFERGEQRFSTVPCIIREGWSEDQAAIELINRNSLTGTMNAYKFTELFDRLKKRYDPEQLKKMIGLTEKKAFNALYKQVADSLPPKQKKKLAEAKEDIKSIDDLTGILHNIFAEHGSELDYGFLVFSHGGKNHHYIKIDTVCEKALQEIEKKIEAAGVNAEDVFKAILTGGSWDNVISGLKPNA